MGGHTVPLSVSIGIATSDGVTEADDVINAADVAMYQAKSSGRIDGIVALIMALAGTDDFAGSLVKAAAHFLFNKFFQFRRQ